jgi:hypothetical protein
MDNPNLNFSASAEPEVLAQLATASRAEQEHPQQQEEEEEEEDNPEAALRQLVAQRAEAVRHRLEGLSLAAGDQGAAGTGQQGSAEGKEEAALQALDEAVTRLGRFGGTHAAEWGLGDVLVVAGGRLAAWRTQQLRSMWEFADAAYFLRCFHTDELLTSLPKCDVVDLYRLLQDPADNTLANQLHCALIKLIWPHRKASITEASWFRCPPPPPSHRPQGVHLDWKFPMQQRLFLFRHLRGPGQGDAQGLPRAARRGRVGLRPRGDPAPARARGGGRCLRERSGRLWSSLGGQQRRGA